ncbi:MAG: 8-amino-7-oxononanoate synthase [Rikenellaceae bacterium]|nr:8-amino-7-oxononanoate synthase [Rikenellaceae bacterium]
MTRPLYEILGKRLEELRATDNLRTLPEARFGYGEVTLPSGETMINLSSNDYLAIASDRKLEAEFIASLADYDEPLMSAASSRLLTGESTAYRMLEETLSGLYGGRAAIVFSSGYHLNSGVLPAICDRDTLILSDKLVHASIIDGIRLSEATHKRFRHNDCDHLEKLLAEYAGAFGSVVIVTESVFSMDGDRADLVRLAELRRRYPNVLLYIDEAHGVGVYGHGGLGVVEELGLLGDIDMLVGTMGKAFGSAGAYLICDDTVKQYLVNRARPFIFTTGLPPVTLLWSRFVAERLGGMTDRRERLAAVSARLRDGLAAIGCATPSQSHIVPVMAGSCARSVELAAKLRRSGFYLLPIRPPTVPEGMARIRISLTAAVTESQCDRLLEAIEDNL